MLQALHCTLIILCFEGMSNEWPIFYNTYFRKYQMLVGSWRMKFLAERGEDISYSFDAMCEMPASEIFSVQIFFAISRVLTSSCAVSSECWSALQVWTSQLNFAYCHFIPKLIFYITTATFLCLSSNLIIQNIKVRTLKANGIEWTCL